MPNSEKSIATLINEFRSNPLPPLELPRIINQLNNADCSIQDFKTSYLRDPLLCTYMIEAAWRKSRNKDNAPIAADHAMSSLGIQGARQLFQGFQQKPSTVQAPLIVNNEVRFLMSSSLLAGEISAQLLAKSAKANQLYWASITHHFPETILWHLKPKAMWRIQYRQLVLPKKLPLFEQAKLGFDLREWRIAVGKQWHMSELNQLTYEKQPPFGRKDLLQYSIHGYSQQTATLKSWHLTDSWLVLTSNWLARVLLAPWLKNSYRHYFKIAQRAFNVSDKKLHDSIQLAIRSSSSHLQGSELFIPAVKYIQLSDKPIYPEWLNAAPKIPVRRNIEFVNQARELKQKADLIAVQKFTHQISSKPRNYRNTNALLRQIMDLTTEKLNFSRASLLVVDWKNKSVSTAMFTKQKDQDKMKLKFNFEQKNPLKKFLVEQAFFVFDKTKHAKIWHNLPSEILLQKVDRFVFFSFRPNEKIEYLLYIDALGRSDISLEKLKTTKQLLTIANKVIGYNTSKT